MKVGETAEEGRTTECEDENILTSYDGDLQKKKGLRLKRHLRSKTIHYQAHRRTRGM